MDSKNSIDVGSRGAPFDATTENVVRRPSREFVEFAEVIGRVIAERWRHDSRDNGLEQMSHLTNS